MSVFNRGARREYSRREYCCRRSSRSLRFAFAFVLTAAVAAAQEVTFNRDVAPIVWARCAICHRPGEIGPFNLLTYDDVRRRSAQIATVVSRGLMPPWKPNGAGVFQNERRLSDRERDVIGRWIAGGA